MCALLSAFEQTNQFARNLIMNIIPMEALPILYFYLPTTGSNNMVKARTHKVGVTLLPLNTES